MTRTKATERARAEAAGHVEGAAADRDILAKLSEAASGCDECGADAACLECLVDAVDLNGTCAGCGTGDAWNGANDECIACRVRGIFGPGDEDLAAIHAAGGAIPS